MNRTLENKIKVFLQEVWNEAVSDNIASQHLGLQSLAEKAKYLKLQIEKSNKNKG